MKVEKETRAEMVHRVQLYMEREYELELGELGAGLLLDWLGELIGPAYYNEGIDDARAVVLNRSDTIQEELFGLVRKLPNRDARA